MVLENTMQAARPGEGERQLNSPPDAISMNHELPGGKICIKVQEVANKSC